MSETRDFLDYLDDVLQNMEKVEVFTKGMSFEEFKQDEKTAFAVIRALEVIGEAVKRIPSNICDNYPDIPWKDIAGMRDVLIHDYFGVDLQTVWETIKKNIPSIKPSIEKIIDDLKS